MKNSHLISLLIATMMWLVPACSVAQDDMATLIEKGRSAEQLNLPDRAADYYRQAATLDPDAVKPHLCLGLLLEHQGKLHQAIQELNYCLSLNDTCAQAYEHLGSC